MHCRALHCGSPILATQERLATEISTAATASLVHWRKPVPRDSGISRFAWYVRVSKCQGRDVLPPFSMLSRRPLRPTGHSTAADAVGAFVLVLKDTKALGWQGCVLWVLLWCSQVARRANLPLSRPNTVELLYLMPLRASATAAAELVPRSIHRLSCAFIASSKRKSLQTNGSNVLCTHRKIGIIWSTR